MKILEVVRHRSGELWKSESMKSSVLLLLVIRPMATLTQQKPDCDMKHGKLYVHFIMFALSGTGALIFMLGISVDYININS